MELLEYHFSLKNRTFETTLLDMNNIDLLQKLEKDHGDLAWDLYNFTLTVKYFNTRFEGPYTKVGTLVYNKIKSELVKKYVDLRIFQLCIENEINEELKLIYNLKGKNFVFKVNLDKIMNKDIVSALNLDIDRILIRTKDEKLKIKIISMNLIYGVFIRFKHLIFFNKKNQIIEDVTLGISPEYSEWSKKILFTKGYVLIFSNLSVNYLVNFVYRRKIVNLEPIKIKFINSKSIVGEGRV